MANGNGSVEELRAYVRARYALIALVCAEEIHADAALAAIAKERGMKALFWGISRGLVDIDGNQLKIADDGKVVPVPKDEPAAEPITDPVAILAHIYASREKAIYVLRDFGAFMDDAVVRRWLRDLASALPRAAAGRERCVVVTGATLNLKPDVEKSFAVVDWPLPNKAGIEAILKSLTAQLPPDALKQVFVDSREAIVEAAIGLTATEAENVISKTLVQYKSLSVRPILSAKKDAVRKSGVLEFYEASTTFNEVGGLENLKEWLVSRRADFTDEASAFGIDAPRGVLLIGPPGCGKSLVAKTIASAWALPLIRFDVARMLGGIVGESEANLRQAIKVAESVAPAVVWLDEIEKAVAGSGTDTSGVTTRMVGSLLTWMTEKTSPVYIVATANDVSALPPELLRKGRFDEIWVVDLPNQAEREQILRVHLAKRKRDASKLDVALLAEKAEHFSGAELEQAVKDALHIAFADGKRALTTDDVYQSIESTTPLATTFAERIVALRQWARGRARMASRAPVVAEDEATSTSRKLDLGDEEAN